MKIIFLISCVIIITIFVIFLFFTNGKAELTFKEEYLEVSLNPQAQILAVRSEPIVISLEDIALAHRFLPKQTSSDLRMPGTYIPGSIKAGTYLTENDNKEFWFTTSGTEKNITTIELKNHEFDRIVLESEKSREWRDQINELISYEDGWPK